MYLLFFESTFTKKKETSLSASNMVYLSDLRQRSNRKFQSEITNYNITNNNEI